MATSTGRLVLSLDFELMWGVRDHRSIADYGRNVLGVRQVVPALLKLFAERQIRCTWATVGLLFFANKSQMRAGLPDRTPNYKNPRLSPYGEIDEIGHSEETDPYWYGQSLIKGILECPGQEIGTHTFSHFYCLEEGGTPQMLRFDLDAARAAADRLGIKLTSIVFPRNQVSNQHLGVCRELDLRVFRGCEHVWFRDGRPAKEQTILQRATRLIDNYFPLAGHRDFVPTIVGEMVDVRASRFLRPARRQNMSEDLRLRTITSAMTAAAQNRTAYHLWWHPHNFGADVDLNLNFLRRALDHFRALQDSHGMVSMTMKQIAEQTLQCTL
jgi:hypothetical protein